MNWVDVIVLVVLALSGLAGFVRGLVRETLGLGAWIGAAIAAVAAFSWSQPLARRLIGNPDFADPAAFGGVFLLVLIVLNLFARFVSGAVRTSALGGLDRSLGLLFGIARGAAVAVAAYIVGGLATPPETWPPVVLEARVLPATYRGAVWAANLLPPDYRPAVAPPPAGRQATAEALLHAAPQGRAVGGSGSGSGATGSATAPSVAPLPSPQVDAAQRPMPGATHGAVPGTAVGRPPQSAAVGPGR